MAQSQFEFKDWNHTIRYPLDGFAVNATSRNDEVNERIVKQQPNLRDMLYKLLTTYQPFNEVSNKANGGKIGNFETLHDGLHSVFGLGHMGIIEVAAFDPIFWFHHCNMDRIVAMYQYRYPDTWIEEADQAMGSYYVKKGSAQGVDSPLAPFHMNADGDMWTSTTVRNLTSFGYTYPELMGNPSNETFTSSLNKLYKPQAQGLNDTSVATESLGSGYGKNTTQATEWLCEVNMPADIKISYSVRAFLGEPDADPKKWSTDNNYVGQLATLSSSRMKTDVIITGSIGLTQKLAQKYESGELQSLNKADVAAYLKTNFHWRIQAFDHSEIPRNKPPAGLNVTVYNVPIQIPLSDTEVPTRDGDAEYDHEIDGNPPVYNGPGIDGTNSTAPASEVGGSYNGTSGEFEWRNDTNTEQSSTLQVVSRTTQAVPDNAWATSLALSWGSAPSRAASSAEVPEASSPVVTSAAPNAEAPEPTMPPGPQTRYVTSVIMEYVTL
jgi:tyrosinase